MTDQIRSQIEPGLIQVLRIFAAVQWGLTMFSFCVSLSPEDGEIPGYFALLFFVPATLLFVLTRKRYWYALGRCHLPVVLFVAALGPVVTHWATVALRMNWGLEGDAALPEPGGILILLLVPLLLISSQYTMRVMLAFALGTAVLDIWAAGVLDAAGGPQLHLTSEEVFVRALLFVMVGYVVVRLTAAQRQQRVELAQKNAQLTHYAATLEQLATSRERNRMARELHNTLAHTLSAASVQLQALEVLLDTDLDAARETVRMLHTMTRSGTQEARRALHALRASPLEDLGLLLAIRHMAEGAADRTGITLHLDLPEHVAGLRADVEQHVYRVAEEAINNVVRHANATTLTVTLRHTANQLMLIVRDDGVGFGAAERAENGRYGLVGMRERALILGGTLTVDSPPGAGTTVRLTVGVETDSRDTAELMAVREQDV